MRRLLTALMLLTFLSALPAAEPPEFINYQGVLRNADDSPRDGLNDMTFHFYDVEVSGSGIRLLTDIHNGVVVSGGLFSVQLGNGTMIPGTYNTLTEMFGGTDAVWLEVDVGGETLTPRIRVIAAPYALNANRLGGKEAGSFLDTSATTQTKYGTLYVSSSENRGVSASGAHWGGIFSGVVGVEGQGQNTGGFFQNFDDFGTAALGTGEYGIYARGSWPGAAGYFYSTGSASGEAYVAHGHRGIEAYGSEAGGYFADHETTPTGYASVGIPGKGIEAYGDTAGGYFKDSDSSGEASVAIGELGIVAKGSGMAGDFYDLDGTSQAKLAWGTSGTWASGSATGGYFEDSDDSGFAHVAEGDRGIRAYGDLDGGYFGNNFSGVNGRVATDLGESTAGNGTKNFIQNHPYEKDKVIRYSSLEGDEVATFTRGTARLTGGEASVSLGATFRWVTNPDVGLTAHLTPHGDCEGLYVASLTTEELIVRERGGGASNVLFDYVVYGLRIGFEESSVVHEKPFEAYIPSMKAHRALYDRRPELRDFNALERFKTMDAAAGRSVDFDFSRAVALRDAVEEYDPAIHGPVDPTETTEQLESEPSEAEAATEAEATPDAASRPPVQQPGAAKILVDRRTPRAEEEPVTEADSSARFPGSEPIEIGDILVLDMERPGHLRPASGIADAAVFGIAAAEAKMVDEESWVELVESRYAHVKADASYGAILPGDLLVSSPTPGHAMRAIAPLPGTIVGKAAEQLDTGTGLIKVLVMLR